MLMWILLGLVVAAVIVVAVYWFYWEDWLVGIGLGLVTALIGVLVTILIVMIVRAFVPSELVDTRSEEYELHAVASGSETSGRFYLLGGYFSEKPSFRYIRAEGDGFVLRSAPANDSVVYEGDHTPRLEVWTYTWGKPWVSPFVAETQVYLFYVPEGSVSNDIEVAP